MSSRNITDYTDLDLARRSLEETKADAPAGLCVRLMPLLSFKVSLMVNEKWPPLDPGTKVKTYKPNTDMRRQWTDEAWAKRRWGVIGVIIAHHDAHGLYYDVRHEDGLVAGYDPSEFDVVHQSNVKWENVVIRGEVLVNGESCQKILIDINAPKDGLFLVTVDPEGKELSRIQVPTKMAVAHSCPFCNSKQTAMMVVSGTNGSGFLIKCESCNGAGPIKETRELAMAGWNSAKKERSE